MSSKTFKSAKSNLELGVVRSNEGYLRIWIGEPDHKTFGLIDLTPSDAPALDLAVLEAAGYSEESAGLMEYVVGNLREHVKRQELFTAEAKEQAELEAEALDYWKAFNNATDLVSFDDIQWSDLLPGLQAKWLDVARRARETRNEKKEPTND